MRISTICFKCVDENQKNGNFDIADAFSFANYDEGVLEYKCKNGHRDYAIILNNKFELLYDSAIICYYSNEYRECIMNIFSCIESFYGYIISLLLYSKKGENISEIKKFMKSINSRSECREGAFCALCKVFFDKEYIIKNKYKSLRNTIVHNGTFTNQEKTLEFAKYAYNFICDCYLEAKRVLGSDVILKFEQAFNDEMIESCEHDKNIIILTTILDGGYMGNCFEDEMSRFKVDAPSNYIISNMCNNDFERLLRRTNLNSFENVELL